LPTIPDICFCSAHVTIDIEATVFLEFSNVIVFTVEQALKHFGIVIPWMVEPDTGE
jgi:hypothetical protein